MVRSIFIMYVLLCVGQGRAQVFGTNLIVNADAEGGQSAGLQGWDAQGTISTLSYESGTGIDLKSGDLGPVNHGTSYFAGDTTRGVARMMQVVDLSAFAQSIDQGHVTAEIAGYLGGTQANSGRPYQSGSIVTVSFRDIQGQELMQDQIAGYSSTVRTGLRYCQTISLISPTVRSARVTVQFLDNGGGFADNLVLVLNRPAEPEFVLGRNLIGNGDAESGPTSSGNEVTQDIPGWQREFLAVGSYARQTEIQPLGSAVAQGERNFFFAAATPSVISQAFQTVDVSAAAPLIDSGRVTYSLSGWLGGISPSDEASIDLLFQGRRKERQGRAVLQGPSLADRRPREMVFRSTSDKVPQGTRTIALSLKFIAALNRTTPAPFGLADNLSLVLSADASPSRSPTIYHVQTASAFGAFTPITTGTWIEIYGANLSTGTRQWTEADFEGSRPPTELDGTSVYVGSGRVPVSFVSPTQVNAYVPICCVADGFGLQDVWVRTPMGVSPKFTVMTQWVMPGLLAPASFRSSGRQYVFAIHADGAYVLPAGSIPGLNSRPARSGEVITLYGVGFGPVEPPQDGAIAPTAPTRLTDKLQIRIGPTTATTVYAGLTTGSIGLYQVNIVVPAGVSGDAELSLQLGETRGTQKLYVALD
jgi:uncharacterized protein (TIGR03437 family)